MKEQFFGCLGFIMLVFSYVILGPVLVTSGCGFLFCLLMGEWMIALLAGVVFLLDMGLFALISAINRAIRDN